MKQLTKTDFISYKECHHNVWVKWHKPEVYNQFEVSEFEKSLGEMGNEVEKLARGMFPNGYLVEKRSEGAQELTKQCLAKKTPVIFQAVFAVEKYLAATDVLKWNEAANAYDLYEIKMSSTEDDDDDDGKPAKVNKKKELQFEYDLAFQANVLEMSGVTVNDKYLIRLNKKYKKSGDLDFTPGQLFIQENKTEAVNELMPTARMEMEEAHDFLSRVEMPKGPCLCYYKGRNSHCTTFSYINPDTIENGKPIYSVHDLYRIGNSKKYLRELLDEGILKIEHVPEDERLQPKKVPEGKEPGKPRKLNQVQVHKTKKTIIDIWSIKKDLHSLSFPLYFLDYETYPTAIPQFNGYHPYQHIVFQYSLHVVTEEDFKRGLEPKHFECLIFDGDPAERIVESLRKDIGDTGSVISWYKNFENHRNRELADLVPLRYAFLHSVIDRTYDLMDIVNQQYYVHHGFKGSSSIKKVLPVILEEIKKLDPANVPNLSYKALGVQSGTDAIESYRQISTGELTGKEADVKKIQMLEYCKLDTYAMYVLWKFFIDLVEREG
ncbi:MAG: DUF2779 domain-containing protein [bacterium]